MGNCKGEMVSEAEGGVKWNKGNGVRDWYPVENGFFDFRG